MPQKPLISSFLPFSFGAALTLPFLILPVFAAETATLPIETHTLQTLAVPPQAKPQPPVAPPVHKTEKKDTPPARILSFTRKHVEKPVLPTQAEDAKEVASGAVIHSPPPARLALPAPVAISDTSENNQNADLQRLRQIKDDVAVRVPDSEDVAPVAPQAKPQSVAKRSKPIPHKLKTAVKSVQKIVAQPVAIPAARPEPRANMHVSSSNPDLFELAGIKLGMNFTQAQLAIANNLGIKISAVQIAGTRPEAQTCTSDTQLSAESEKGSINVQFTCNAGLPLHRELSVNHISYEPETGMIENVFALAVKKYGNPVNASEYNPLKAEYVSYDWCSHPLKDRGSENGQALHCLSRNESRLRLQGRDNSLEFELAGVVGAAKYYDDDNIGDSLDGNGDDL
ncbi:hypothetical protein RF55_10655 [Lasius niger]|uniref:Uncharacterized protein n=1 Tax=Lasius niger TaxID=67767 RepID=A0A0J7KGZ4_LASNI|nr:hypothetical protein RF55_10655 [Lasius niger]